MALSRKQISQLWVQQGGDPKWAKAMAGIALRESGGRPGVNNRGLNKNGTVDWGLFQVNDIWRKDPVVGKLFKSGEILTPEGATQAAIRIMKVQGPQAWASSGGVPSPSNVPDSPGSLGSGGSGQQGTRTKTTRTPGVDRSALRRSLIAQFVMEGGPDNPNALLGLATSLPNAKDTPAKTVRKSGPRPSGAAPAAAPVTGTGKFTITGPNPGRLTKPLVGFARKVAATYGKPLTGSDGSGHSKYTVDGNISDHYSGNATDIPATGNTLLQMGRAALVAAGMPRAQAMKAQGGLYNVNGHQVIFLTNQGGNHFDHLHISV